MRHAFVVVGVVKGKGYAVNVPLKDGIMDEAFKSVFEPVSFYVHVLYICNLKRAFYFRLLLGSLMYINLPRLYCNVTSIYLHCRKEMNESTYRELF